MRTALHSELSGALFNTLRECHSANAVKEKFSRSVLLGRCFSYNDLLREVFTKTAEVSLRYLEICCCYFHFVNVAPVTGS